MFAASLLVLLGCATAHLALAAVSPSPWWVPDLTLAGLVLSVARAPTRWLALSGWAGFLTVGWAVRFPGQIFTGYLLIGWASQMVARQWDATDLRIECVLVAAGSLVLMLGMLWLADLWSPGLVVLSGFRAALTCGIVPLVHHLAARGPQAAGAGPDHDA